MALKVIQVGTGGHGRSWCARFLPPNIEDNLQSVALIFAAIASSRTGQPIQVQDFLEKTRQQVLQTMA
jgi:hypothetical protein